MVIISRDAVLGSSVWFFSVIQLVWSRWSY